MLYRIGTCIQVVPEATVGGQKLILLHLKYTVYSLLILTHAPPHATVFTATLNSLDSPLNPWRLVAVERCQRGGNLGRIVGRYRLCGSNNWSWVIETLYLHGVLEEEITRGKDGYRRHSVIEGRRYSATC